MSRFLRSRVALVLALAADLLLYAGSTGPYDYTAASFEAALAAQEQVTEEWLAKDGVVGTAIGVDGMGKAVLKVYLTRPGAALVPSFVSVASGTTVRVLPEITGEFRALPIEAANAEDADPTKGWISTASPIGRGLMGKEVGDEVTVPTPNGVREFEIVKLTTIHDE